MTHTAIDNSRCQSYMDIERLVYSYCSAIDQGDIPGLQELFKAATITLVRKDGAPPSEGPRRNGDQFAQTLAEINIRYGDGTFRTKHVVTNLVIDISANLEAASATSYITVFQATEELPLQAIFIGRYEDTFACHNGTWRFVSRLIHPDLIGNMKHHVRTAETFYEAANRPASRHHIS